MLELQRFGHPCSGPEQRIRGVYTAVPEGWWEEEGREGREGSLEKGRHRWRREDVDQKQ